MKYLLLSLSLFTVVTQVKAQACNRRADPNKVVLMLSFHEGSEEERGARQGACERGETLVIIPQASAEYKRHKARVDAMTQRYMRVSDQIQRCTTDSCRQSLQPQLQQTASEWSVLSAATENIPAPDYQAQLNRFLQNSRSRNVKVSSLIVSGHDGGGEFYGDYGGTDMAAISQLTKDHPEMFNDTTSLLLMGCWTGTPDQVAQWRVIFPKMRVLGGFVGSAPSSTRLAAGTYISGLLRGERNLPRTANRNQVQAMINTIQHMNMVTAGVYVNPACEEEGRSPAYFYISPASAGEELGGDMRPGMNVLPTPDQQSTACMRTFGGEGFRGSYDWNAVLQYYQGEREPENNQELRSLYSFLRNNENCFREGLSEAAVTPEQVLMLRFFQDVKKNFNKYFKNDLEEMYRLMDEIVAESSDLELKALYERHKKLHGDSLLRMTRKETLEQISAFQGIYDRAFGNPTPKAVAAYEKVSNMFSRTQTHLHRLKCMPPTWHEYVEGETLAAPTCNADYEEEDGY